MTGCLCCFLNGIGFAIAWVSSVCWNTCAKFLVTWKKISTGDDVASGNYLKEEVLSLQGLEFKTTQAEPVQSVPEPALEAKPTPAQEQKPPAEKKNIKPKWLKMWYGFRLISTSILGMLWSLYLGWLLYKLWYTFGIPISKGHISSIFLMIWLFFCSCDEDMPVVISAIEEHSSPRSRQQRKTRKMGTMFHYSLQHSHIQTNLFFLFLNLSNVKLNVLYMVSTL